MSKKNARWLATSLLIISCYAQATCTLSLVAGRPLTVSDLKFGLHRQNNVLQSPQIQCQSPTQVALWVRSENGGNFAHAHRTNWRQNYQLHWDNQPIPLVSNEFVLIGHFHVQQFHQPNLTLTIAGSNTLPDGQYQDTLTYRLQPP